jgi:hypothetical protein
MAAPDTFPVTIWQALAALAPLVGGGGIASIIVAWFGFRRSVRAGGRSMIPQEATLAIAALYTDHESLQHLGEIGEKLIKSIDGLGDKIEAAKLGEKIEGVIDEARELRRSVEDHRDAVERRRRR